MADNYDYLNFSSQDTAVLKNLTEMASTLKDLKAKQLAAEEVAKQAKDAYEHYANVVIPQAMAAAGVESLNLIDGGTVKLKHNFYCQPNKNDEDKAKIAKWLREHGGEHLIESELQVDSSSKDALTGTGIPFVEKASVNTTKLKSFLKEWIGATTGQAQGSIDDIPKCIHFSEVVAADITL